ncbi:hypothetical protein Bbelb_435450 [Branchiostoma belcheri]|nr:hypothetical protein Bbelb_435450 [Branchiostoma belcheri]
MEFAEGFGGKGHTNRKRSMLTSLSEDGTKVSPGRALRSPHGGWKMASLTDPAGSCRLEDRGLDPRTDGNFTTLHSSPRVYDQCEWQAGQGDWNGHMEGEDQAQLFRTD